MARWRKLVSGRLPKGRVARGIVTLASGTAAAQAITICAMPVVTRLYTPAQIGVVSLFLAFFNFWSPALSLRYEYALLIAQDDLESHVVNRLAMICVAAMSILAVPLLAAMQYTDVLGFSLLPWWAPVVAMPTLFGFGQFMVCRAWGLRAGSVHQITHSTMARSAANAVTRVGLGALGAGVPGLFIAELAGAWGSVATLYRSVHLHFAPSRPSAITRSMLYFAAKRYIKFAMLEAPSTYVNQLALTLPVPMIASLHGAAAAGWFGLARALVAIPNAQIGTAVGDVFQMELARAVAQGDHVRGRRLFYTMLRRLGFFGLIPTVGVMLVAPWLMATIFGTAWRDAGWIAAAIAPWLYMALVVSTLSRLLSVLAAQEYKLVYDLASVTLCVLVYSCARHLHWQLSATIVGFTIAGVVAYALYAAILVAVVESRLCGNSC